MWTNGALLLAATVLVAGPSEAQSLSTVRSNGTGDFTTIQGAVDASADGDIVLVQAGAYPDPVTIDDKGITLVVDEGVAADLNFSLFTVQNLGLGKTTTLRGLDGVISMLHIFDNQGAVWVEDCEFSWAQTVAAVHIRDSSQVVLVDTAVTGRPATLFTYASDAVVIENSTVGLYDCSMTGGDGTPSTHTQSSSGGNGVTLISGSVLASGCSSQGGPAGPGLFGGNGISNLGGQNTVLDCVLAGGAGSTPGQPTTGPVTVLPEVARTYRIDAPKRFGEEVVLTVTGEPGDLVILPHNTNATALWIPSFNGMWLIDFPGILNNTLGFLDGAGQWTLTFPAPSLGGLLDGFVFYGQSLHLSTQGSVVLGAGSAAVFVNPIF